MKRSSVQLNTKDDKQGKNLTKMFFTLHSSTKIVNWVENNAQTPSKIGSQLSLFATVPLYHNFVKSI